MPNLKDASPDKRIHGLFIGPSGSGKTCASVTVGDTEEKESKVFVIDCDNRIKGVLGLPELKKKVDAGLIEYEQFNKKSAKDNVSELESRLNSLAGDVSKGVFQTVVLSSTTSATEMFRENVRNHSSIPHYSILGKVMTQVQDYGYIARAHRDMIVDTLNKLPCHVIIETHLTDDGYNTKKENGEEVYVVTGKKINLPGQLSAEVPTWYDECYEFYIDETVQGQARHMVKFHGKLAKTTFPRLPQELNWTGKNFYRFVSGVRDGVLDKMGNVIKK